MAGAGRGEGRERDVRGRNGSVSEWLWARWRARWSGRRCGLAGWHRRVPMVGGRRNRSPFPFLQITLPRVDSPYVHHHHHVLVKHLVGFWVYYSWIVTIKIKTGVVGPFRIRCGMV